MDSCLYAALLPEMPFSLIFVINWLIFVQCYTAVKVHLGGYRLSVTVEMCPYSDIIGNKNNAVKISRLEGGAKMSKNLKKKELPHGFTTCGLLRQPQ